MLWMLSYARGLSTNCSTVSSVSFCSCGASKGRKVESRWRDVTRQHASSRMEYGGLRMRENWSHGVYSVSNLVDGESHKYIQEETLTFP
jgi:hypothetical protein